MKKIGILGGTFDPIHNGHMMLGTAALHQFHLDILYVMPTGIPAYKLKEQKISSAFHRKNMVEAAILNHPGFKYSELELSREGNTYTADTLKELSAAHPGSELYYIAGADSLDYMDRWYQPEIIFSHAVILAAMRKTQSHEEVSRKMNQLSEMFNANIHLLQFDEIDISSTMLRKMVQNGEPITQYVPEAVETYIRQNGLYRPSKED